MTLPYPERERRAAELGLKWEEGSSPLVIRDVAHVDEIVALIEAVKNDGETAHYYRDELLLGTLRAICAGATDPATLAEHALLSDEIDFSRWYA